MSMKRERSMSMSQFSGIGSPQLDHFATHGWVYVQNVLSPSELRVLQTESSALYSCQSAESIVAQGCVVDVLAQCPMRDSDRARIEFNCYLEARSKNKSVEDQRVFGSLLFEKLPTIAGKMLAAFDKSEVATDMFFFNEHYVIKPPKSHVEFRWHRDDDEQLAMCVHRESIHTYVSVWCALDDVTTVNGPLRFVSLNVLPESDKDNVESRKLHASGPVTAAAGDVVFFLSNVWHCSSSNESNTFRRAFYAQYSRETITSRPKDPSPLSFAIPCITASAAWVINGFAEGSATKSKHLQL
ncbi:hypothetical protein DD237_008173 [Peronospora effusa]|uniref:Phytanoyl-CoA dioxygenase n=1 Tax=Peronospora effusa TaxID=542832 RepID=A0A3R8CR45_9STRA|nr:hypothetical protein DD237_008173 [Peronospora effusa]